MNANAQLAALATLKALAAEHGEVFMTQCLSAILLSRVIMPAARPAGCLGRVYMTREQAKQIVLAIDKHTPMPREGYRR